jgi:hypothetical protein
MSYDMERGSGGGGGGGGAAARRRRRQQSSSFADDWSFELGHMAIFGCGDGSEEAVERAEARVADQAIVELAEGVENDEAREPEEDCEIGMVQVVNWYTQEVVSEASAIVVTDDETGEEMLEFRGTRLGRKQSRWVLRVRFHETVLETMRAVGAMAYKGDVPGPTIDITLGAFDRWDGKFVNAESPEGKTWTDVRRMYHRVSEFICEMRMYNPHAVIVRA